MNDFTFKSDGDIVCAGINLLASTTRRSSISDLELKLEIAIVADARAYSWFEWPFVFGFEREAGTHDFMGIVFYSPNYVTKRSAVQRGTVG